jgi:SHS2 domain-containing protein
MHSLLFNFLDELLFVFSTELFVPLELRVVKFDRTEWQLEATGYARSSKITVGRRWSSALCM